MDLVWIKALWAIHLTALLGLALYGIHRLWFLALWLKYCRFAADPTAPTKPGFFPMVTVQLPVFNERFVAGRLLDAVAALEYPADRLEIQVLDDSTDDTSLIIADRAAFWRKKGIRIHVIQRKDRSGFKAGALAHGLKTAAGELVAIFDADFVPDTRFLIKTVPCFADPKIGMVQCRWAFLNPEASWLTRIQSLLLESHFRIEHNVRYRRGYFFNFNGTAGIWRKQAICDAGGWQADTLTEDLDLSYRAQLAGWQFIYQDDHGVFSELPTTLSAFRSQQQRWTRGSIQTAKKMLPRVLLSKHLPLAVKMEAFAHLTANFGWLLCFILILTLYPAIIMDETNTRLFLLKTDMVLFFYSSGAVLLYFIGFSVVSRSRAGCWIPMLPLVSIGMAPVLSLSVLGGLYKTGGTFFRTPKFGSAALPKRSRSYHRTSAAPVVFNFSILVYTLVPLCIAWQTHPWLSFFPLFFPLSMLLILVKDIEDWLWV